MKKIKNNLLTKKTIQVLENRNITNEERLIFLLDNYKNFNLNPLILKILEERKNERQNNFSKLNEGFNKNINLINDVNEKDKKDKLYKKKFGENVLITPKKLNDMASNSLLSNEIITYPVDDKILFSVCLIVFNISSLNNANSIFVWVI